MRKNVKSADELIAKLGGVGSLSDVLNEPYTTVDSWQRRGRIPLRVWGEIIALAKAEGIVIDHKQLADMGKVNAA